MKTLMRLASKTWFKKAETPRKIASKPRSDVDRARTESQAKDETKASVPVNSMSWFYPPLP